jgi:hypothetical protein
MRKKLVVAVLAALVLPAAARAAATTVITPLQIDLTACNGDTIRLSGQTLAVFTATVTPSGGVAFSTQIQPQGVRGVDLQTGATYLGTGVTRDAIVVAPSGVTTITLVNRFHIQATAGGESFDAADLVHVTALPDGTVTAFVDNVSLPC